LNEAAVHVDWQRKLDAGLPACVQVSINLMTGTGQGRAALLLLLLLDDGCVINTDQHPSRCRPSVSATR